jgi:regulator of protease activity HflC (stomatin/prohibitin superfamily)
MIQYHIFCYSQMSYFVSSLSKRAMNCSKQAMNCSKQGINYVPRRSFITIIDQATVAYRQLLGMNRCLLKPGIRLNLPVLHQLSKVDMREGSFTVDALHAHTKENIPVIVSGTLFYQVRDPEKACYGVQNYLKSIYNVGTSSMRGVLGRFEYDKIICERNLLNSELVKDIHTTIDKWGVGCTRFEIQRFEPENEHVKKQLELQMEAERKRRQNEKNVEADNASARGAREQSISRSEGEAKSKENNANADLYTTQKKVDALKYQLDAMTKLFGGNVNVASQYIVELAKLEQLKAIASGSNNTVYFIDQTTSNIVPQMKIAGDLFTTNSVKPTN